MPETRPTRSPIFDYAYEVDPAMSAFGWRYIVLAYVAVLVPLLGILLPRDTETNWQGVSFALLVAVFTMALNTRYLRSMFASGGWSEPPPIVVLAQAVAATVAIGVLNWSLSGLGGFYRPLILMPTMILTVIGNRFMVAVGGATAIATLVVSTWAQGTATSHLAVVTLTYGVTWVVLLVMFRMIALRAMDATRLSQGIADAAAITARADHLDDGLQRLLPVIGAWAAARRVTVYVVTGGETALFDHWPIGTEPCPTPSPDMIERAVADAGATVVGEIAVIVADAEEAGGRLVAVVEGPARNRFEVVSYHYQLLGMAEQFASLVTRSQRIAHLLALSTTDGLTGLPNRRALEERLDVERAVALQRRSPLTLVMIDLDDFKIYNDTYGHPAGDEMLCRFADALRTSVRSSDFVARYGGEEFCLLLPATTAEGAAALTNHLRDALSFHPAASRPAFSAGIATWDTRESNQELLRRADSALYAAKEEGKDRSVIM
jgi:diguanylate cyclase (GGDEF)-like protein